MSKLLKSSKKNRFNPLWTGVIGWAYLIFIFYSVPDSVLIYLNRKATSFMILSVKIMLGSKIEVACRGLINDFAAMGLIVMAFAVLSVLLWAALDKSDFKYIPAAVSWAATFAAAFIFELYHGLLISKRVLSLNFIIYGAGALLTLSIIIVYKRFTISFPRVFNRENVSYLIFGVLTTLINILVYGFCYNTLGIHNLISNVIAWILAVLFAYVVNKLFVFRSVTHGLSQTLHEFALFIGARFFSLGIDELGMWILVNILTVNEIISKIFMNIIVLIINYFFSKTVIFNKNPERPD